MKDSQLESDRLKCSKYNLPILSPFYVFQRRDSHINVLNCVEILNISSGIEISKSIGSKLILPVEANQNQCWSSSVEEILV